MDPLRNPKDPLHHVGPEREKELFRQISAVLNGVPNDIVSRLAVNMLMNSVRQQCKSRNEAESVWDEVTYQGKSILLGDHYSEIGTRKNIFPFHQTVSVPHLKQIQGKLQAM